MKKKKKKDFCFCWSLQNNITKKNHFLLAETVEGEKPHPPKQNTKQNLWTKTPKAEEIADT
jgi:hypothetical protein